MSQSKRQSVIETCSNTATGFVGSYLITFGCFHLTDNLPAATLYATLGCTVWSLVRGYYLRRLFNKLHTKQTAKARHDFIQTGDADSCKAIEDCNGEVVLSACRACGCAEGQLATDCPGEAVTLDYKERLYNGYIDYKNGQWVSAEDYH